MEKYTMFVDWKNQYSDNEYTTQGNLQIQCNPYQATNGLFHRARTNNFKICMEIQKTSNSHYSRFKFSITSWGKDFSLQLLSHRGAEWREIAVFEIRGESLWSSLEGVR